MKTYEIQVKAVITKTLHVSGPPDKTTALKMVTASIEGGFPLSSFQKYEAGKGNFAPPTPVEELHEILQLTVNEVTNVND